MCGIPIRETKELPDSLCVRIRGMRRLLDYYWNIKRTLVVGNENDLKGILCEQMARPKIEKVDHLCNEIDEKWNLNICRSLRD